MNSIRLMKSSPSTFISLIMFSKSSLSDAHLRLPTMMSNSNPNIEFLKNCSSSAINAQLFTTTRNQDLSVIESTIIGFRLSFLIEDELGFIFRAE
ncbi:hypothetical protein PanWU01x14_276000 [Parasponia andersonii]|uniref:Uncharacterized protein n=1 Tax=Parasponia andersonii TaxID=3476 RepID=A0A2P5B390_PARAD|nr:hypothetical protein PanWU01x14_276000 [Parasponia andersonii]